MLNPIVVTALLLTSYVHPFVFVHCYIYIGINKWQSWA